MGGVVRIAGKGCVGFEHTKLAAAAEQRADAHRLFQRDAEMHRAGCAGIGGRRGLPARSVVREAEGALKRFGGDGDGLLIAERGAGGNVERIGLERGVEGRGVRGGGEDEEKEGQGDGEMAGRRDGASGRDGVFHRPKSTRPISDRSTNPGDDDNGANGNGPTDGVWRGPLCRGR